MKEEIIETRPLTEQKERLRPREGGVLAKVSPQVRTGPQVSQCPSHPVLSQLLISSSPVGPLIHIFSESDHLGV